LVDKDCPLDKACRSQECVNPCLTTQCGTRAVCEVDFHTAICVCPPGLQGNPQAACIEAGCRQDSDCATNEKCGFIPGRGYTRKECQPLCNPGNCAIGADCTARNHKETCSCRFPLKGDGYAACVEPVISEEPECRVDVDCPPQMTCMRETCQNPCIVSNPCTSSQQCIVTDTFSSIRSVACVCPPGTLAGYGGTCTQGILKGIKQIFSLSNKLFL
jgi:hypothetical protein